MISLQICIEDESNYISCAALIVAPLIYSFVIKGFKEQMDTITALIAEEDLLLKT